MVPKAVMSEKMEGLMKEKERLESNVATLTEFLCGPGMPGLDGCKTLN